MLSTAFNQKTSGSLNTINPPPVFGYPRLPANGTPISPAQPATGTAANPGSKAGGRPSTRRSPPASPGGSWLPFKPTCSGGGHKNPKWFEDLESNHIQRSVPELPVHQKATHRTGMATQKGAPAWNDHACQVTMNIKGSKSTNIVLIII